MRFIGIIFLLGTVSALMAQAPPPGNIEVRNQSHYHPRTQQLLEKYQYYYDYWTEDEVKHGRYSQWDSQGRLIREARFQHGELQGLEVQYYPDGQIQRLASYHAGKQEGSQMSYYRNGKIKLQRVMTHDGKNQSTIRYTRKGKTKKR